MSVHECLVGALLALASGKAERRQVHPPWENTNQKPPTDVTDAHRFGGYGILPYPRSH